MSYWICACKLIIFTYSLVVLPGYTWQVVGSKKDSPQEGARFSPIWFPAPDYNPGISLEEAVKAVRRTPSNPIAYLNLSIIYAQRGQWSNSLKMSQRLTRVAPQDPNGYLGAAYAYVHLGKPYESLRVLEEGLRVIKIEFSQSYLHRAYGDVWLYLYEQRRDSRALAEAGKAYDLALRKNSGVALARIGLARIALLRNRLQEAEGHLRAALQVAANKREKALAYYYLGLLREREGNKQAANSWYAKALQTHRPSFQDAPKKEASDGKRRN